MSIQHRLGIPGCSRCPAHIDAGRAAGNGFHSHLCLLFRNHGTACGVAYLLVSYAFGIYIPYGLASSSDIFAGLVCLYLLDVAKRSQDYPGNLVVNISFFRSYDLVTPSTGDLEDDRPGKNDGSDDYQAVFSFKLSITQHWVDHCLPVRNPA